MRTKLVPMIALLAAALLWLSPAVLAQEQAALPAAQAAAAPAGDAGYYSEGMSKHVREAIDKSLADPATAEKFKQAVTPGAEPGYLGIPGAPSVNWIWALLWAVWVGWIFSTVGAFGGIMAGVGHITIFGFGEYASKFGKGAPVNAMVTDSIRVSNQWLAGLSALIGSFKYYRMGRLVAPLGICMAVGAVGGSWLIPAATAGRVSLKDYVGYFGLCVLLLGVLLLRDLTAKGQARQKKAKEAASAFEKKVAEGGDTTEQGVKVVEGSWPLMMVAMLVVLASAVIYKFMGPGKGVAPWTDVWFWACTALACVGGLLTVFVGKVRFTFFGVEFGFKAWLPMLGGAVIAALSSFLGVGGGFLYVPFLTTLAGLPMFLVAGTSSLVVLVGMIVSIFSYMFGKGVVVEWGLIGAELVGVFIGSMVGPATSKFISDKVLRLIFIVLAFYVGLGYTLKGLFGMSLPPF
ncbi:sulfite exporter TauE/SafE family protein [Desulfarculus baarsii]